MKIKVAHMDRTVQFSILCILISVYNFLIVPTKYIMYVHYIHLLYFSYVFQCHYQEELTRHLLKTEYCYKTVKYISYSYYIINIP